MTHWLDKVVTLFSSETTSLRELAEIAGYSPSDFYVGADMDGADLRGQDLRGMKFPNIDITKVKLDTQTKLDDEELFETYKHLRADQFANYFAKSANEKRYQDRLASYMNTVYQFPDIDVHSEIFKNDKSTVIFDIMPKFIIEMRSKDDFGEKFRYMKFLKFTEELINGTYTLSRRSIVHAIYNSFRDEKEISQAIRQHYSRFF